MPRGDVGELMIKGPIVMQGYYGNDEATREALAANKVPRSVQFVPDLPRTSTGKVMRRELKTLDADLVA